MSGLQSDRQFEKPEMYAQAEPQRWSWLWQMQSRELNENQALDISTFCKSNATMLSRAASGY